MISVDGMWKRIMELSIFGLGWQTSTEGLRSIWMVLFLVYLFYILWQLYDGNVKGFLTKKGKEEKSNYEGSQ